MNPMKILSWNVSGMRAIMKKGFMDFMKSSRPDIICLQEVKAQKEHVELKLPIYEQYWNPALRPGYAGTAVLSKIKPAKVKYGMGKKAHDKEGRVVTLEFPKFYLINVYTPNSGRGLPRLSYRQEWDKAFLSYMKGLDKKKPVMVCGDLNVAHKEIDLANPKSNKRNAGFTEEERTGFDKIINAGFVDSFREFHKGKGQYTFWVYFANARKRNVGWRIDYVLVSKRFMKHVKRSYILPKVMGSDHCPIGLEVKS